MVIPALLAGDLAGFLLGPFRQSDIRCQRGRGGPWPEDYQVVSHQLDLIERRAVIFDDLPQIQPELLEGGVAARLILKVGQPDLPLWLRAAVQRRSIEWACRRGKEKPGQRTVSHPFGAFATFMPIDQPKKTANG